MILIYVYQYYLSLIIMYLPIYPSISLYDEQDFRDQMLKGGIVPKLITLLKTPSFRGKTLKLLYHLSVDDRCKSMVTYTDGRSIIYTLSLLSQNHYNHHHYHHWYHHFSYIIIINIIIIQSSSSLSYIIIITILPLLYHHHHHYTFIIYHIIIVIIIIIIPSRNRYSYSDGSSHQFSTRLSCQ